MRASGIFRGYENVNNANDTFQGMLTGIKQGNEIRQTIRTLPLQDKLTDFNVANAEFQMEMQPQMQDIQRQQARFNSVGMAAVQNMPYVEAQDVEGLRNSMMARRQQLQERGLPTQDTDEILGLLNTDPQMAFAVVKNAADIYSRSALGKSPSKMQFGASKTFKDEEGNVFYGTLKNDPSTGTSGSNIVAADGSGRQPAGKLTMVGSSGLTSEEQIDLAGQKAGATEKAKLGVQKKFKPEIERAVTKARQKATEEGTVFNELNQAEAAMPQLLEVVDRLKELAPIATSTYGGKAFDFMYKEMGFGATQGATAREKYISIINNQVLPLLKPTFGAQFTVQEGESLKATLGDPDAAPETKVEVLESFIEQKMRDIKTKQAQLDAYIEDQKSKGVPTISTQKAFDELEDGDSYIYNGKLYIKGQ